jgi:integrase
MHNEIILANPQVSHLALISKAKEFATSSFAELTLKGYQKDWKLFEAWCEKQKLLAFPCPINTLILYVTDLANKGYKVSTLERKVYAIAHIHFITNLPLNLKDRDFKIVFSGIKRKLGTIKKGKAPLMIRTLREIAQELKGDDNITIRDKALITFGWASAMRRSEIIALNWFDIVYIDEGILVNIRKSKTDQYGQGQKIAILYGNNEDTCPVRNLKKWQAVSGDNEAIFTSVNKAGIISNKKLADTDVARIIKKLLVNIKLDPSEFAGHSLRSGFITTAAKHSVPDHIIMKHSRHKTSQMLQVYTRDTSLVKDNATAMVGL